METHSSFPDLDYIYRMFDEVCEAVEDHIPEPATEDDSYEYI